MSVQPVISATHTIGDGLVIRWRRTTHGEPVVSASRNAVMVHGTQIVSDTLKLWILAAEDAHELLQDGRDDEAKALATHEYDRPFLGELMPIKKPATASPNGDQ